MAELTPDLSLRLAVRPFNPVPSPSMRWERSTTAKRGRRYLPIYISEPPAEAAIAALVTEVVSTADAPDFLAKALTDGS